MSPPTLQAARVVDVLALTLGLVGCGLFGEEEAQAPASRPVVAEAADWPAQPVAAFRPAEAGACPARYQLQHGTCVHVAMRGRISEEKLARQVEAYRAGAASPRVGGGPAPAELAEPVFVDPSDPSQLPPDALTIKRLDATEAKQERLRQLDEMIRLARIRAGELPDPAAQGAKQASVASKKKAPSAAGVEPVLPPSAPVSATGDTKTLSEMTDGLPPEVLKTLLADIERNGGTAIVPAEELEALQRRAGEAAPDELAGPPE